MNKNLNIGFLLFHKNTYASKTTGVWGDEIVVQAQCEYLRSLGYSNVKVCTKEELLGYKKLDVCIHTSFQILHPQFFKDIADKNVLWIQGFSYNGDSVLSLDKVYEINKQYYDSIITSSRVLAKTYDIPFVLPYTGFEPYKKVETKYDLDISFIGNIIKPFSTNIKYFYPFRHFKYGIFGGDFGKVSHETSLEIISGSRINFRFGFEESSKWDMVTGTPFFFSMCEAFTMMDYIPYFTEVFGESMTFTKGGDDEREKIGYYLENNELRKKMAKEAQAIVKSIMPVNILEKIGE